MGARLCLSLTFALTLTKRVLPGFLQSSSPRFRNMHTASYFPFPFLIGITPYASVLCIFFDATVGYLNVWGKIHFLFYRTIAYNSWGDFISDTIVFYIRTLWFKASWANVVVPSAAKLWSSHAFSLRLTCQRDEHQRNKRNEVANVVFTSVRDNRVSYTI